MSFKRDSLGHTAARPQPVTTTTRLGSKRCRQHRCRQHPIQTAIRSAVAILIGLCANPAAQAEIDLTELPLEQLLNVEVSTPSKLNQKSADSAASITVISAEDIKAYGYRTLADVLNSVRGIYINHDHIYDYVGVRGFSRPGDFSSRVLLMVDGYRVNDNVYDQSFYGQDFLLDIDLIKRIEVVRGASSSVYGSNALLGVINVITRDAKDIGKGEVGLASAGVHAAKARVSLGKTYDNGLNMVLSVTKNYDRGSQLKLTEPELNNAANHYGQPSADKDFTRNQSAFAKFSLDNWQLQAAHITRNKGNAIGYTGALVGAEGNAITDQSSQLGLRYQEQFDTLGKVSGRLYYGNYHFRSVAMTQPTPPDLLTTHDEGSGSWWGSELGLVKSLHAKHTLVAGLDLQQNLHQNQRNYDLQPYALYLDDMRRSRRFGLHIQDEYQATETLNISLGLRADKYSELNREISPRVAMIYKPHTDHNIKLLYGTAFRAPNVYERYYSYNNFLAPNPLLQPERIKTLELAHEFYLSAQTRLSTSLYGFQVKNLIDQGVTNDGAQLVGQFQNISSAKGKGLEFEIDHQWQNGARLRSSLTQQSVQDVQGIQLSNSPRIQYKLNASAPVFEGGWRAALELQSMGRRIAIDNDGNQNYSSGFARANFTLMRPVMGKGAEFSFSIYNLFDRRYTDPVGADATLPSRSKIEQDGRNWQVKWLYRF